jgi:hypothetical protein
MADQELQNVTKKPKKLSAKQKKAANLVSEDFMPDEQIAAEVGITRQTLTRWKAERAFVARVAQISQAFADHAMKYGLARRAKRLALLNRNHDKLEQVIAERAADPQLANVPGGTTGLITRTLKGIGKGDDYQVVEVYEVDTPTLREMRAIYDQVAEELGQKTNKLDVTQHTALFDPLQATDEELIRNILSIDYMRGGGLGMHLHKAMQQYKEDERSGLLPKVERPNPMVISPEIIAKIKGGTKPEAEVSEEPEA